MIEHLAIRREEFVGGTRDRPELKAFIQANTNPLPFLTSVLSPGQTVWMKWSGGPVVAKATVQSWEVGTWSPQTIDAMRSLTSGTLLHEKVAFWEDVRRRRHGHYVFVRLIGEEWLTNPRFGGRRSYGSSWVVLRSVSAREEWLGRESAPKPTRKFGRGGDTAGASVLGPSKRQL